MFLKSIVLCLALTSYHEARGEPLHTQIAVQRVLLNRARENHSSPCREMLRAGQFSFDKGLVPRDCESWARSLMIARSVNLLGVYRISRHHMYFNHVRLGVRYRTGVKPVVLGKLVFY
jgi:hypothetical protein